MDKYQTENLCGWLTIDSIYDIVVDAVVVKTPTTSSIIITSITSSTIIDHWKDIHGNR